MNTNTTNNSNNTIDESRHRVILEVLEMARRDQEFYMTTYAYRHRQIRLRMRRERIQRERRRMIQLPAAAPKCQYNTSNDISV